MEGLDKAVSGTSKWPTWAKSRTRLDREIGTLLDALGALVPVQLRSTEALLDQKGLSNDDSSTTPNAGGLARMPDRLSMSPVTTVAISGVQRRTWFQGGRQLVTPVAACICLDRDVSAAIGRPGSRRDELLTRSVWPEYFRTDHKSRPGPRAAHRSRLHPHDRLA